MDQPLTSSGFCVPTQERTITNGCHPSDDLSEEARAPELQQSFLLGQRHHGNPDVSVVAQESTKLYSLLQSAVDLEIQQVGFMPEATTYGMKVAMRTELPYLGDKKWEPAARLPLHELRKRSLANLIFGGKGLSDRVRHHAKFKFQA